jgi:hypothetical protein
MTLRDIGAERIIFGNDVGERSVVSQFAFLSVCHLESVLLKIEEVGFNREMPGRVWPEINPDAPVQNYVKRENLILL